MIHVPPTLASRTNCVLMPPAESTTEGPTSWRPVDTSSADHMSVPTWDTGCCAMMRVAACRPFCGSVDGSIQTVTRTSLYCDDCGENVDPRDAPATLSPVIESSGAGPRSTGPPRSSEYACSAVAACPLEGTVPRPRTRSVSPGAAPSFHCPSARPALSVKPEPRGSVFVRGK